MLNFFSVKRLIKNDSKNRKNIDTAIAVNGGTFSDFFKRGARIPYKTLEKVMIANPKFFIYYEENYILRKEYFEESLKIFKISIFVEIIWKFILL